VGGFKNILRKGNERDAVEAKIATNLQKDSQKVTSPSFFRVQSVFWSNIFTSFSLYNPFWRRKGSSFKVCRSNRSQSSNFIHFSSFDWIFVQFWTNFWGSIPGLEWSDQRKIWLLFWFGGAFKFFFSKFKSMTFLKENDGILVFNEMTTCCN
jgi:hypothetical protein